MVENMSGFIILIFVIFVSPTLSWVHRSNLPVGPSVQYYNILRDGGYNYGFENENGQSLHQSADIKNEVNGEYVYPGSDQLINVKYTAGVNGYIPIINTNGDNSRLTPSSNVNQKSNADLSNVKYKKSPKTINDASYQFSYIAKDSSRKEESDSLGNVRGAYSYKDTDGLHIVNYIAGPETGFVITGDNFSKSSINNDGTFSISYLTGQSNIESPIVQEKIGSVEDNDLNNNKNKIDYSSRAGADSNLYQEHRTRQLLNSKLETRKSTLKSDFILPEKVNANTEYHNINNALNESPEDANDVLNQVRRVNAAQSEPHFNAFSTQLNPKRTANYILSDNQQTFRNTWPFGGRNIFGYSYRVNHGV